ncbi:MAG: site-specific DNA-methyltransferase [Lachnospiraceae bacterium]|nr:site-specific DNA-methyltransferase [Lachnospiraceae bacterium]
MMNFGYYNMDCIIGMKNFPDKYFDIAVVDPPYFSGPEKRNYYGRTVSPIGVRRHYKPSDEWEIPNKPYFDELYRVSKHQIIWGCNYFDYPFGPGRIVWDKCNGKNSFSDCEIAYCSMHDSVRLFRYMWNGMMQGKTITEGYIQQGNKRLNEKRIHPTQKPVALYEWILSKYAKAGDIILDTHVGSASSLIACHNTNHKYIGFELDEYYYKLSSERLKQETAQLNFFEYLGG